MTAFPARAGRAGRRAGAGLPRPRTEPLVGHLGRWGREPLALLTEGAALGPVFELRLWRRVVVGYRPAWNRLVLRDLDSFRSRGSLSRLTPYLAGGVVLTDLPDHRPRRRLLNPHLRPPALEPLRERLDRVVTGRLPRGRFEALAWSAGTVRAMLSAAFFGDRIDAALLDAFLRPLERPLPHPLLPRPRLFGRMDRAIQAALADPGDGTLTSALAGIDRAAEELRVALAAGFDTTAHTLAWALWHLAGEPAWRVESGLGPVIDETLRLYPSGWLGSRVTSRELTVDVEVEVDGDHGGGGVRIPARTLVLYSPYLTHRDPDLWPDPLRFRPDRFADGFADGFAGEAAGGRPPWAFIPFSAGQRTCLGAHLARLLLRTALSPFCRGDLRMVSGSPAPAAGLTLRPRWPMVLERRDPGER